MGGATTVMRRIPRCESLHQEAADALDGRSGIRGSARRKVSARWPDPFLCRKFRPRSKWIWKPQVQSSIYNYDGRWHRNCTLEPWAGRCWAGQSIGIGHASGDRRGLMDPGLWRHPLQAVSHHSKPTHILDLPEYEMGGRGHSRAGKSVGSRGIGDPSGWRFCPAVINASDRLIWGDDVFRRAAGECRPLLSTSPRRRVHPCKIRCGPYLMERRKGKKPWR